VKAYVVTDKAGKVVAHVRETKPGSGPAPGRPTALPGQTVHEIELPQELRTIQAVSELHQALEKHLGK
jgi:hypothetical protein